jgi:hypothetical protein
MPSKKEKFEAIEIRNLADWEMLCVIQPSLKEAWASENIGSFFVVTPGELEGALIPATAVKNYFDEVEPNTKRLKFVKLIREERARDRISRRSLRYSRRYRDSEFDA